MLAMFTIIFLSLCREFGGCLSRSAKKDVTNGGTIVQSKKRREHRQREGKEGTIVHCHRRVKGNEEERTE
jgi:hypothetical protein